jgi:NAD(P)-dependent dehydrogenase (short-subunit alcohol dehydrogenase family)
LINNAGGMYPAGKKTIEGIDLTFATNHLGHFLLTTELLPALVKGKGRIINVSSEAHRMASNPREDLGLEKSSNTGSAYGKVKLFNILFTKQLKKRLEHEGVTAFSLHPGAVKTAFGAETSTWAKIIIEVSKLFFISPKAGAQTTIFLTQSPLQLLNNGSYYVRKKRKKTSQLSRKEKLGDELWEYSEDVLKNIGLL